VKKPCKKHQQTTQERKAGCPYKEGCSAFLWQMVTNEKRHENIGIHLDQHKWRTEMRFDLEANKHNTIDFYRMTCLGEPTRAVEFSSALNTSSTIRWLETGNMLLTVISLK
jgi:hypothetical protein